MKSLLIKIKNFLPYLLLISIYFLFVNIEAQKQQQINQRINKSHDKDLYIKENSKTIAIPVIPYNP